MGKTWFVIKVRLNRVDRYALWYTNDTDGVCTSDGYMLWWKSAKSARAYAKANGLVIKAEPVPLYKVDGLIGWLVGSRKLSWDTILDAWNLFSDISTSLDYAAFATLDKEHNDLYGMLFRLTKTGKPWRTPDDGFSGAQLRLVHRVIECGVGMLKEQLEHSTPRG